MNDVEKARNKLLIALFVESHRPERRQLSREQLQSEYFLKMDTPLFNGLAKELRDAGLIKIYPDRATYVVRLRSDAHAAALGRILAAIDAESFNVNWQGQRIGTDADSELSRELLKAIPDGWLLLTWAKDDPAPTTPTHSPLTSQHISAARDVIMVGGNVHHPADAGGDRGSLGWTKWRTIFGGLGLIVAIAAIFVAEYL
ncbi:hypothetical protein [Sphingopyxis sp. MSC1_008]|jgi:hypothetical protein|uniref:hypothetical protein n=1 Tax=Sphingopyxis sp. MSC1_008 TaxID=2909265 RepID=UPI0020BDA121|nr:hypothetical protein [Sphingopyxis sp. MSC1_008]